MTSSLPALREGGNRNPAWSGRTHISLTLQITDYLLRRLSGRELGRINHHGGILWRLVGIADTREVSGQPGPRLGIKALTVACLARRKRRRHVNQHKASQRLDHGAHFFANRAVGRNGRTQGDPLWGYPDGIGVVQIDMTAHYTDQNFPEISDVYWNYGDNIQEAQDVLSNLETGSGVPVLGQPSAADVYVGPRDLPHRVWQRRQLLHCGPAAGYRGASRRTDLPGGVDRLLHASVPAGLHIPLRPIRQPAERVEGRRAYKGVQRGSHLLHFLAPRL